MSACYDCGLIIDVECITRMLCVAEYAFSLNVTTKGDVYSFGIILIELLTERRPTSQGVDVQAGIVKWAHELYASRNVKFFALTLLKSSTFLNDVEGFFLLLKVAILCTEAQPTARPTMREVLVMLDSVEASSRVGKHMLAPESPLPSIEELAHAPCVWECDL